MIELTDVTKRYGQTVAVDHLSFEVRPGEVTGFLGPNGAGKSTTMRSVNPDPRSLTPWVGFGVLLAYVGVSLAVGAVLITRRDA